jgi:hypothetical protein
MRDLIARLRTKPGLEVVDQEQSWKICARKPDGLTVEVTVPHDVLEWFVTVLQTPTGKEVWSDWMDYYSAHDETETELRSDMSRHIEHFIERSLASTFRIVESRKFFGRRQRLEWQTDGDWRRVVIYENVV